MPELHPADLFVEAFDVDDSDSSLRPTLVSAGMLRSRDLDAPIERSGDAARERAICENYLRLQHAIKACIDELTPERAAFLISKLAPAVGRQNPNAARVFEQLAMDIVLQPRAMVGVSSASVPIPAEVEREVEAQQHAHAARLKRDARRLRMKHERVAEALDLVTASAGERAARIVDGLTIAAGQLIPAGRVVPKPPPTKALALWLALSDADRDAEIARHTELSRQCYWPGYYWDENCHEEDGSRLQVEEQEDTWTNGVMIVRPDAEALNAGCERALALARLCVSQDVIADDQLLQILGEFSKPLVQPTGPTRKRLSTENRRRVQAGLDRIEPTTVRALIKAAWPILLALGLGPVGGMHDELEDQLENMEKRIRRARTNVRDVMEQAESKEKVARTFHVLGDERTLPDSRRHAPHPTARPAARAYKKPRPAGRGGSDRNRPRDARPVPGRATARKA